MRVSWMPDPGGLRSSTLRRLGLLVNNKPRLRPEIYLYLKPDYDYLAPGLRQLLGVDLSGPTWCVQMPGMPKARIAF